MSKPLDGRHLDRVRASLEGRKRRDRWDDRIGVRIDSSWDLPECSLCLVAHPGDAFGVLADEPCPEWKRYFWEGAVGYVLAGKRVLMHPGPHVTGVDAHDGNVAWFEFC